jgi:hypothetical protein
MFDFFQLGSISGFLGQPSGLLLIPAAIWPLSLLIPEKVISRVAPEVDCGKSEMQVKKLKISVVRRNLFIVFPGLPP